MEYGTSKSICFIKRPLYTSPCNSHCRKVWIKREGIYITIIKTGWAIVSGRNYSTHVNKCTSVESGYLGLVSISVTFQKHGVPSAQFPYHYKENYIVYYICSIIPLSVILTQSIQASARALEFLKIPPGCSCLLWSLRSTGLSKMREITKSSIIWWKLEL